MADAPLVELAPWRGINNIEHEESGVYAKGEDGKSFLREAINVDLTKEGFLQRRVGQTKLATLTDGHSMISVGGMLLVVDNGTLKLVHPGTTASDTTLETLASGLATSEMSFAEIAGEVFYANGVEQGRITNGAASFWGLMPPAPPLLASAAGGLPAGEYQVALTCESSDGIEGGSRKPSKITLSATGGITVSQITADANAAYVNVYLSSINGQDLFWTRQIASSETSVTLVDLPQSRDPIDRILMYPPPPETRIVRGFKGRILAIAGKALYFSQPLAYHLFKYATDVQLFAEEPVMLEPVDDGFYLAEGNRTWWVSGDDPETWRPIQVDDAPVASGKALHIPGHKLPALGTTAVVAVWASAKGFVAGLPGGRIAHLTDDSVAMDANAKSSITFREQDGLAQLLLGLRQKTAKTRMGASDRATCTVIKGGLQ